MMVRVVIVDDSSTMRRLLRLVLSREAEIDVVGEAANATEAADLVRDLKPDVLTLDVEMPGISGLEFLAQLMAKQPMPVVMVSSETQAGSTATVDALSLGAVDCIGKPVDISSNSSLKRLPDIIIAAAKARVRGRREPTSPSSRPVEASRNMGHAQPSAPATTTPAKGRFIWNRRIVLIGASTGGVEALERVLEKFPANGPPTLITQHMPESFLSSFVQRLDSRIAPRVALAQDGEPIEQGRVYLAPGGKTHLRLNGGLRPKCHLFEGPKRSSHRPSVDELFESALPVASNIVSVLLTGMGRDGADGMNALHRSGASCLAQDEQSSVVWGMPRVAYELGATDGLFPLSEIGDEIIARASRKAPSRKMLSSRSD